MKYYGPLSGSFLAMLLALSVSVTKAQTSNAGYVSQIEAKARQILALERDIESLKSKLPAMEAAAREKIATANARLAEALDKIKNDPAWQARLETAQRGWEEYVPGRCSAGGPPPKCPENHWFRTSVRDAMAKYEEYKNSFLKPYRQAVERAKSDRSEFQRLEAELQKKQGQLPDLRREIVELSRKYDVATKESAEERAARYAQKLVRILSEWHYQEMISTKYDHRIAENNQTETIKMAEAVDKVTKDVENMASKIDSDIRQLERDYQDKIRSQEIEIERVNSEMSVLQSKIKTKESEINFFKGTDTERLKLENDLKLLRDEFYAARSRKEQMEQMIKQWEKQSYDEKSLLSKKMFDFRHDAGRLKAEARKIVADAFSEKRKILQASKDASLAREAVLSKSYRTEELETDRAYKQFANHVEDERQRMLAACRSVSTSCYGVNVTGDVHLAWNKAKGCAADIHRVKGGDGVIYGCHDLTKFYAGLVNWSSDSRSSREQFEMQSFENRLDNLYNQ